MKYLHRLIALVLISAGIFSCQKEYSIENPTGTNSLNGQWEFKEGGVQFKGTIDTVSVDTINTYTFFTLVGRSDDGSAQMTLQVFGKDLKPGTYKTPFSLFAYIKGGTPVYQTDQTATDSFTIVISKADSTGISGTFNGKASGKTIVDGKFSAPLKHSGTNPPPASTDSGQVVLWSKALCTGGGPINVTVNGKAGQITKLLAAEPTTCDPAGTYFIKLPVGTYPWVAKCGADSVSGMVTVTKGGCAKTEVNFAAPPTGDYFPMTAGSYWKYLWEGYADTLLTTSLGNIKTFNTKQYYEFNNTDGDVQNDYKSYYRKSLPNYYEYFAAATVKDDSTGIIIDYPAYESTFLIDNKGVNGTFYNTYTVKVTLPGFPAANYSASDTTTVLATGVSATVGTKTFTDVIKIKTGYYTTSAGVSTILYKAEQWFARGVGLIKYIEYDYAPYTTPTFTRNIDPNRYKVF